ncbi:hypothetical protein M9H77_12702 [Catharanthus roseus]|uniref:Uncharacterized protein n=1 Tax=Catharanthus roseus TaxID=4058 RepID=A0ACC0BID1_CATRO|nr:hypothetical protein M9H77_12702 [Catharanthus roseus]
MTRDAQETVKLLQCLVTRAMAKRMEEEHQGKIAIFKKMTQDLASQTLLFSELQVEEAKETSLEDLEASKPNREEDLSPIAGGKILLPSMIGHSKGGGKANDVSRLDMQEHQ